MLIQPGTIVHDSDSREYTVLEEVLGHGSFGFVNKLVRQEDNTDWALKTVPPVLLDEVSIAAFRNEGKNAMAISHLNVIRYLFFHDGTTFTGIPPYIIMEFADGGNLEELIKQHMVDEQFLSKEQLTEDFRQLAEGMKAVNSVLVHRDIKPDNVLISGGQLKISDFGLCKIVQQATRTSTFKGGGCLPYLAPEGWKNETNTMQMDIYSMGIVFYQLATLNHPYEVNQEAELTREWYNAHLFQQPTSPMEVNGNLPIGFSQLIGKMMAKSTTSRCRDWDEVLKLIPEFCIKPAMCQLFRAKNILHHLQHLVL